MPFLPDLPTLLLTTTTTYLTPIILLLTTPKCSPSRTLTLLFLSYLTSTSIYPVIGTSPTRCSFVATLIVTTVQAGNLLLLNPLDDEVLSRENPSRALFVSDRFRPAFEAIAQTRAIGTSRQVRNIPSHPGFFAREIRRDWFLVRQGVVFIWEYLACDIFQTLIRRKGLEQDLHTAFEHIDWFVPLDTWIERVITNLLTWFVLARLLVDAHYRLVSIIFVGFALDEAENWPPAFGRMGDAYTIRRFWGKFWHQFFRQPFTALSNFITRNILSLSRPSIRERYTNIFIVFLLSALLHTTIDFIQAIPLEYSGSMPFFLSMVLAIMVEDGAQALWKRFQSIPAVEGSSCGENTPLVWKRALGMLWVMAWLGVTSTWYWQPMSCLPQAEATLIPISLVEWIGVEPVGVMLLVSGVGLYVRVGLEI